eukprot:g2106.t1
MSRRLQKELKRITVDGTRGYEKFKDIRDSCEITIDGDNIMTWKIKMQGPEESLYEKGVFSIELEFPERYPHKPPEVKNRTPILHPNTTPAGDMWCRDLWAANWGPTLDVAYVLRAIRSVMMEPNLDSPVNVELTELWRKDKTKAAAEITAHIAKHANSK